MDFDGSQRGNVAGDRLISRSIYAFLVEHISRKRKNLTGSMIRFFCKHSRSQMLKYFAG